MEFQLTAKQLTLLGVATGVISGIVVGLIPFFMGWRRGQKRLAVISLIATIVAGMIAGLLLILPTAAVFCVLILRKTSAGSKEETDVTGVE
jgi:nitrate/nitrite transporter NarK